jgi:hypothetical protein
MNHLGQAFCNRISVTKAPKPIKSFLDNHKFEKPFGFDEVQESFKMEEQFLISHALIKWKVVEESKEVDRPS